MYEQIFDMTNEMTRKALEAGQELAAINGKVVSSLLEKQVSLLDTCVKNGTREFEMLKGVSNVNDVFTVNVEVAQKNATAVSATFNDTYEVLQGAAKSYSDLLANNVEVAKAIAKKTA